MALVGLYWRIASRKRRVELVYDLLRNRAVMLDEKGRSTPGISVFGIAPTEEEFRSRANSIVDDTGRDMKIDRFGNEMVARMDRWFRGATEALDSEASAEADPADPDTSPAEGPPAS